MTHTRSSKSSIMSFSFKSDSSHRSIRSATTASSGASITPSILGPKSSSPFKVVIVGAGVGGLVMALCLERAGIDYVVLERAQQLPVPKSMIQLSANTLRALEQLGLLDEILAISKPVASVRLRKQNMTVVGEMDGKWTKERYGYHICLAPRSEFCQIILSHLPPHKVQWGRYVLDIVNGNGGVQCRCANGQVEQGDILVGADGAHSAVRQNLYRSLREKNMLPKPDMEPLKFTLNAIMGLTDPMDLEQFPNAGAQFCDVDIIVGKDAYFTIWITSAPGNRFIWSVGGEILTPEGSNDTNFKQSEFGPEGIDAACALIQDLPIPGGGTMADMLQNTKKDCLTKIMVEEKHYTTWYHGRTVLVGEACHKFVPFSGQGAEQAILDVVCLVNLLFRVRDNPSHGDFCTAFENYVFQRSPVAKDAVATSGAMSHLMNSQGFAADFKRKVVFNLPEFIRLASYDKISVRPLLDFLPPIEDRGYKKSKAVKEK
ncbi:hypothetical protein BGZ80_009618 [Entomortierella chlamydospora]|uniref:FAD-binding domain-containing protein n=1 Tax=Entomortierella chlamydospora TaxID=101097 RepID=A0A9P6T0L6_9FUNG|nr:hypothetical protein BGZ79_002492 [Entomortierella chlamydospora]KAG0015815.1 hypothetical protein BGZ80_009618 [Entomortierella chlamydospora]